MENALAPLTEKRCHRCDTVRPLSAFRRGLKKGGVFIYCKPCQNTYLKQRRAAARDIAVTRTTERGKTCTRCLKLKAASSFLPSKRALDGFSERCTQCRMDLRAAKLARDKLRKQEPGRARRHKLRAKYGMTEHDFLVISVAQANTCAVCRVSFDDARGVCVDHNHDTGQVRGLLCHNCNTAIGFLKDSPTICRIAAEYLESASTEFYVNPEKI